MTKDQKIIRGKAGLLELTIQLGNISHMLRSRIVLSYNAMASFRR